MPKKLHLIVSAVCLGGLGVALAVTLTKSTRVRIRTPRSQTTPATTPAPATIDVRSPDTEPLRTVGPEILDGPIPGQRLNPTGQIPQVPPAATKPAARAPKTTTIRPRRGLLLLDGTTSGDHTAHEVPHVPAQPDAKKSTRLADRQPKS